MTHPTGDHPMHLTYTYTESAVGHRTVRDPDKRTVAVLRTPEAFTVFVLGMTHVNGASLIDTRTGIDVMLRARSGRRVTGHPTQPSARDAPDAVQGPQDSAR